MQKDRYSSIEELARHERDGIDYQIRVQSRFNQIAVIAPHGGCIEPGRSEIVKAVAGDRYRAYWFEGFRNRPHHDLHVTSTNFRERRCLDLIADCVPVIAIHGCTDTGTSDDDRTAYVDGLDIGLRDAIRANLERAGFVTGSHPKYSAQDPHNICNLGKTRMGVQLEICLGFRDWLREGSRSGKQLLGRFAAAVVNAIEVT